MEAKLVIQTAAPGYEDEIFEDAAARSISFQPDESRTESGKQTHYGRCGLRGETDRRWFSMYVTKFSDGSSETQTYYYDTVGTSK